MGYCRVFVSRRLTKTVLPANTVTHGMARKLAAFEKNGTSLYPDNLLLL